MNIQKNQAVMYIFARNNGSGKSTFRNLIVEKQGIPTNIDPDSIAKKYKENKEIRAGKEAIRLIEELILEKRDFSMETTFRIIIYYMGVEKIFINLNRIRQRVEQGGHDIPQEDVLRRESRSLNNLLKTIPIADEIYLVDNTYMQAAIVAGIRNINYKVYSSNIKIPQWIHRILKEIDLLALDKEND